MGPVTATSEVMINQMIILLYCDIKMAVIFVGNTAKGITQSVFWDLPHNRRCKISVRCYWRYLMFFSCLSSWMPCLVITPDEDDGLRWIFPQSFGSDCSVPWRVFLETTLCNGNNSLLSMPDAILGMHGQQNWWEQCGVWSLKCVG